MKVIEIRFIVPLVQTAQYFFGVDSVAESRFYSVLVVGLIGKVRQALYVDAFVKHG